MRPYQIITQNYNVTEDEMLESALILSRAPDELAALGTVANLSTITAFKPTDIAEVLNAALEKGYGVDGFACCFDYLPSNVVGRKLLWFAHSFDLPMRSIFQEA